MNARKLTLIFAAALTLFAQADITLQRAARKEALEGDLKGAIELYRKAFSESGNDRSVAANALIRMAECYQKMGDAESRKVYERVVREYADQKDVVAAARARMGGNDTAVRTKGDRAVWTGPRVNLTGGVSSDGRFITYVDWSTGVLFQHDVGANSDRPLTNVGTPPYSNGFAQFSTISRDTKRVAYEWYTDKGLVEIRIVGLQGTGIPQSQRVFANEEIGSIAPFDWSPDGKLLVVHLRRKDQSSQIGLVAVQDGSLRVLKSIDWRGPSKIFFSPDGRYIAYDLPSSDTGERRDIFVMAIDGSRETIAVAHPTNNIVMGWSPDGKYLLFSSDRTGSMALWALAFAEGKPQGTPEQVKAESSTFSFGLNRSGALYVSKAVGRQEIRTAAIDWSSGKLILGPVNSEPTYIASKGDPDWSRDGKFLSNVSCGETGGGPCRLQIQSRDTGKVRELPTKLWYFAQTRWAPDGRSFLAAGRDNKGRQGIYQIDSESGAVTLIAGPRGSQPQWSADGKKIYYRIGRQFFERELSSGHEQVIFQLPVPLLGWVSLSPDGRYCVLSTSLSGDKRSVLLMRVAGGEPRELIQINWPQENVTFAFTPDSQAVIVAKTNGKQRELWRFPVTDGQPRKLEIDTSNWAQGGTFSLHPDGRQIAFVAGRQELEVWALDNFLATLTASK